MEEIIRRYKAEGGNFITDPHKIVERLQTVKAYIFDWDGVFNNGEKAANGSSNFSEVDSMGTNLLRYSHYLNHKQMPLTAVISGEKNETAFFFCKREGFDYSFYKVANKINALNFICEKENIEPNEIAYFFDDVLDLPIAEKCGLRILINQKANPLFANYCINNGMADYITFSKGGEHAVREATELLMALRGNYETVIHDRKNSAESYSVYIEHRKKISTEFYTINSGAIQKSELA